MKIYLAPINFTSNTLVEEVSLLLSNYLHLDIEIIYLDINISESYAPERNQYFSTRILSEAIKKTDEYNGKVVLLIQDDLYVPALTFIYGEAQLNGKHSIVSLCRLYEEFYTGRTDDVLLIKRLIKEIMHELGHNFGLYHCRNWDCVMHASLSIEEVDIKGSDFCPSCKIQIEVNNS